MTIVAEKYAYVTGVDTHARTHTYAIINGTTGARTGCEAFPVTTAGMKRAIAWIRRNTTGGILAAVEGTSSYGASLTRALVVEDIPLVEAKPPRKKARAGAGKTDVIDAVAAAARGLPKVQLTLLPAQHPATEMSQPIVMWCTAPPPMNR